LNSITYLLNFIKMYELVQKLIGGKTQTERSSYKPSKESGL
jgi:hypothetical protein